MKARLCVLMIRPKELATCSSGKEAGTRVPWRPYRNLNPTFPRFDPQACAKKRVAAISNFLGL
jgi:hypothetical protein